MKLNQILTCAAVILTTAMPLAAVKASSMTSIPCPVCHMPMTTSPSGMMTVPLLVHGKKFYCCPMCAAGKKAAAYDKMHPGKLFVAEK